MIELVLLIVALILVVVDLVRTKGQSFTAWAVLILIVLALLPHVGKFG